MQRRNIALTSPLFFSLDLTAELKPVFMAVYAEDQTQVRNCQPGRGRKLRQEGACRGTNTDVIYVENGYMTSISVL